MTYEEACTRLGFATLPLLEGESRERLIRIVVQLSKNGTGPISPFLAKLCRVQFVPDGMTCEEACALPGHDRLPYLGINVRNPTAESVREPTESGKKSINPRPAKPTQGPNR